MWHFQKSLDNIRKYDEISNIECNNYYMGILRNTSKWRDNVPLLKPCCESFCTRRGCGQFRWSSLLEFSSFRMTSHFQFWRYLLWSRFLLRGATQFFTRFSTHFPAPGEVQETRRTLVTGRRAPRLKTMVELVLQSTFRILDERFEYSFSVENEERK